MIWLQSMKIYAAKEAGFCFGVKRALEVIDRLHELGHGVQVYGQLIHNRSVLDDLKARGIDCIDSSKELDANKTLIIRTHGIPKEIEKTLKKNKVNYVDATCPLVKKVHKIVEKIASQNKNTQILIIGDKNHPEIVAAKSYSPDALIINSQEEAHRLENKDSISVVAQTTMDADFFEKIISILKGKTGNLHIHNTICKATKVRQEAIKKLAPQVDSVIVVGGKNSANSKKLYNIALQKNKNTFFIEKSSDLHHTDFIEKMSSFRSVGITAGASTPPGEIEKIEKLLRNLNINAGKETNHGRRKRNPGHEYRNQ